MKRLEWLSVWTFALRMQPSSASRLHSRSFHFAAVSMQHQQQLPISVAAETDLPSVSARKKPVLRILGIETSCDDTGIGVVDSNHRILSNRAQSQLALHNKMGGIIPPLAGFLHETNIRSVYQDVCQDMTAQGLTMADIDAVGVTTRPGLVRSLEAGLAFAKELCRTHRLPLFPIHHMEAHALTARLIRPDIQFPFLTLLVSGGHCLLALVRRADDFVLLGTCLDDAPGEALDKIARRLNMFNMSECAGMSGGKAIEYFATKGNGDVKRFEFPVIMSKVRNCDFSFAGLKWATEKLIIKLEQEHNVGPGERIPYLNDLCACVLHCMARSIGRRVERAIKFCSEYVDEENINDFPLMRDNKDGLRKNFLVVSGGVAANSYIKSMLSLVCSEYGYELVAPPPSLCTDNGVMIAWNGIERLMPYRLAVSTGDDISAITSLGPEPTVSQANFDGINVFSRVPLGVDWRDRVATQNIEVDGRTFRRVSNAFQRDKDQQQHEAHAA